MSEWISVNDKLPDFSIGDCDNCDRDCPDECEDQEYLVTIVGRWSTWVESAFYEGDGRWVTPDGEEIEDVIAWMTMPEPYVSPTKYRWRLSPAGYGNLREAYLVASTPFLMVSEWECPTDKSNYKNVFTEEEYYKLSKLWDFDPNLFVPEDASIEEGDVTVWE